MKTLLAIFLSAIVITIFTTATIKSINLKQDCTGYLKRAADANTVETALKELNKATTYLEQNNLTNGYTSVLWKTPDEDVTFWYNNLKASEKELSEIKDNTSALERTNILMKLRETLLDNGEKGENLTVPNGLSRYPNNGMWAILFTIMILICIGLFGWMSIEFSS